MALRLLMPKFFEWSVAKNMLCYLPEDDTLDAKEQDRESYGEFGVGPIGIPSVFAYHEAKSVQLYLKDMVLQARYAREVITPRVRGQPLSRTVWERGMECVETLIGLTKEFLEEVEIFTFQETRVDVISEITSETGLSEAGNIPNFKISKRTEEKFIRVDQPEGLIKKKELPYSYMIKHGRKAEFDVIRRKSRAGHLLRDLSRVAHSRAPQQEGKDLSPCIVASKYQGTYVLKDKISYLMKFDRWKPGLALRKKFFAGKYVGPDTSELLFDISPSSEVNQLEGD
jgi:hypothetical protein